MVQGLKKEVMMQTIQKVMRRKLVVLIFLSHHVFSGHAEFSRIAVAQEHKRHVKVYTYYYYPEYEAYYQAETGLWLYRRGKNVPWSVSHRAPQKRALNWSKANMPVRVRYQGPDPFANSLKIKQDTFPNAPVTGFAPVKVKTSWSSHTKNGTGIKVRSVYRIKH